MAISLAKKWKIYEKVLKNCRVTMSAPQTGGGVGTVEK